MSPKAVPSPQPPQNQLQTHPSHTGLLEPSSSSSPTSLSPPQHTSFKCPLCLSTPSYPNSSELCKHLRTAHIPQQITDSLITNIRAVRCPKCQLPFKGLQGHKCHPTEPPTPKHLPTSSLTSTPSTQLPKLASVLSNPVPTVRSIKPSLFPLLKRVWDPILKRIAAGDSLAWEELATLPSHLLASTPRGGARGTATLKFRMESFLKNEPIPPPLTPHRDPKPFNKIEKAEASAKAGRLSLAAKHLFKNNTLLPYSHGVIKNLKRKHPPRDYESFGSPPCSPTLTLGDTMGAIESAPRSSSQDQWGYRYEHWQALLKAGTCIHDFMRDIHCGIIPIPPSIQPTWSGGNLLPFAKPQQPDDVRPIVISLTLRRLISRAALAHIQKSAKDFFLPFQFGVGVKKGEEKVIHFARDAAESGESIIQLDISNAFNTLLCAICSTWMMNTLPKLGLHLNPSKCTIFNKDPTLMQNNRGLSPSPEGIKVLGSFIGEGDFVARSVKAKVNLWASSILTLDQLKSFQLRLLMLRHTLAHNPNYLCRTTPAEGAWFTQLNRSIYTLLQGLLKSPIPNKNQDLIHWPTKQGAPGMKLATFPPC
ncbi:hypothetical protein Pelo_18657 [Pelomyxa schiedti]|nr:hypothetical protein Pelo_18657 [Pelomyxa schiedti]